MISKKLRSRSKLHRRVAGLLALGFALIGTGALYSLIPTHGFVQQVWIYPGAKHRVGKVHLADVFAFKIFDVYNCHCR